MDIYGVFLALPCLLHAPGAHIFFFFCIFVSNLTRWTIHVISATVRPCFYFVFKRKRQKSFSFFSGDDDDSGNQKRRQHWKTLFSGFISLVECLFIFFTFEREFSKSFILFYFFFCRGDLIKGEATTGWCRRTRSERARAQSLKVWKKIKNKKSGW